VTDGLPKISAGQKTKVQFFDVNSQVIAELNLKSNEYGTVQGVFNAPQGVLNGRMRIQNETGSSTFNIEEYKRPRFETSFLPVKGSYRTGEMVSVQGNAKTYSGVPVDGARVTYRVFRKTNFPDWCYWYRGIFPQKPAQEIISGVGVTDKEGNFSITFLAQPDASIPKANDPIFHYEVKADVTDLNGETRSTQTIVIAAYVSLEFTTDFPVNYNLESKQKHKIVARNLSGTPQPVIAAVQLFKIKEPERLLRSRDWPRADRRMMSEESYVKKFPFDVYDREDDFLRWEKEKMVWSTELSTGTDSILDLSGVNPEQGFYLLEVNAKDSFGADIKLKHYFTAFNPASTKPARNSFQWMHILKDDAAPGKDNLILISSAAKGNKILIETEVKQKIIAKQWIQLSNEQRLIRIPVKEEYRGNFSVHISFVKEGRVYSESVLLKVPWDTKDLSVEYETFRSVIEPGKKEEWKIKIKDKQGEKVAAELLVSMYDASLDAFKPHSWKTGFYPSYYTSLTLNKHSFNLSYSNYMSGKDLIYESYLERSYDALNWFGYEFGGYYPMYMDGEALLSVEGAQVKGQSKILSQAVRSVPSAREEGNVEQDVAKEEDVTDDTQAQEVQIRKNLQETAFFFPNLELQEDSAFAFSFTTPEALTRWKLQLFAHTRDLKYAFGEKEIVTRKELMVVPNLPRFLRAGDTIDISAKINSLSIVLQEGKAELTLFDAFTMKRIDTLFSNLSAERGFQANIEKSENVSWRIRIPENVSAVVMRITAKSGNYSDGEEQIIPILTNRILMTETMPIWTKGIGTKNFEMKKLSQNSSTTLQHHRLTLEYTSNPIWTVIQALPYMMEYPYDCAEQIFSRYYSNSIAAHIANSSPKMKAVFQSWKSLSPESFLSKLEKNQELKSVVLEETPWVLDAKDEKERKERVGLLFDLNRMNNEQKSALTKLIKAQNAQGAWSWFKGMPEDRYITQHIVSGLAHLDHLGIASILRDSQYDQMLGNSLSYLDRMISKDYQKLLEHKTDLSKYKPSAIQIQYLYLRSYDICKKFKNDAAKEYEYFLNQTAKHWLGEREYMLAMIALVHHRSGNEAVSKNIINSLKENAQQSEELGMYWKNNSGGYFWTHAAIETQAILIEAFTEIEKNPVFTEAMKLWLLRQKQTHNWQSTKATTEACYALLLKGNSQIENENVLQIRLGERSFQTNESGLNQEAGTGTFSIVYNGEQIDKSMGRVQVSSTTGTATSVDSAGSSVSWGALYWQYFEDIDKIVESETGAMKLAKNLFIERNGPTGPVIEKVDVNSSMHIGDKIVVRIEIRTDRDMEYVHLKDLRASGFEPVNVISSYKWQDGLGYYESTGDASTDFFISFMPKGTYVFKYLLRASQSGDMNTGPATIQNMYAPEFSAKTFGGRIQIISR
nr:hypothetical protein [Bacteroidia bacterium]